MKDAKHPPSHPPPSSSDRRKLIADFPSGILLSVAVTELQDTAPASESTEPSSSKSR